MKKAWRDVENLDTQYCVYSALIDQIGQKLSKETTGQVVLKY